MTLLSARDYIPNKAPAATQVSPVPCKLYVLLASSTPLPQCFQLYTSLVCTLPQLTTARIIYSWSNEDITKVLYSNIILYLNVMPCVLVEREKSLLEHQFVITHTIHQTEIPTLLRQLGYEHTFCHNLCPQKFCLSLYFHKNLTGCSVDLLRINQASSASCNAVYLWDMTLLFQEQNAVGEMTATIFRLIYPEDGGKI